MYEQNDPCSGTNVWGQTTIKLISTPAFQDIQVDAQLEDHQILHIDHGYQ